MSIQCIVPGCPSNQFTKTLFRFPTDNKILLEKWIRVLFSDLNCDIHSSYICEDHFSPNDLIIGVNNVKMLVSEAVPKVLQNDINFSQSSCRFCGFSLSSEFSGKIAIDSDIKRFYYELMNEKIKEDLKLSESCCNQCASDLKYCSTVKNRILEYQKKLFHLHRENLEGCDKDEMFVNESLQFTVKQETEDTNDSYFNEQIDLQPETEIKEDVNFLCVPKLLDVEENEEKVSAITFVFCNECGMAQKSKKSLAKHKSKHHSQNIEDEDPVKQKRNKRRFSCSICNLSFSGKAKLLDHKKIHHTHDENPYRTKSIECEICGKQLASSAALRNHILKFHPQSTPEKSSIGDKSKNRCNQRVPCLECGLMFSKNSISKHIKRIHRLVKDFQCDLCGVSCFLKRDIIDHMKTKHTLHREKIKCDFCEKQFLRQSSLYYHVKFVHFKIMQEICELCGLSFVSRPKYEDHYRAKHSLERPFQCDECEKAFSSSAVLYKHKASSHSKVQAACDICSKVYPSVKSMQNHKRLVHREKVFVCEFENCGMRFSAKSLMRTHMANHSGIRKFQCEICESTYKKRDHLVRHFRSTHMNFCIKCEVVGCKSKYARKDFYRSHVLSHHKDIGEEAFKLLLDKIRDMKEPEVRLQNSMETNFIN